MNKTPDITINNPLVALADAPAAVADMALAASIRKPAAPIVISPTSRRPPSSRAIPEGWRPLGDIARRDLVQNPIFGDAAYRAAYKPGDVVIVYCAGNAALQTLSKKIGRPAFKYGAHSTLDLTKCLETLNREKYAGYVRRGDRFVAEPGWDEWVMQQIELVFSLHPGGPICASRHALRVTLPSGYFFNQFDRDLHRAIAASSLIFFANTTSGQDYLKARGVTSEALKRWTPNVSTDPDDIRYEEATECYFTTPFVDMSRLAIVAERLILRHLDLKDARALPRRP